MPKVVARETFPYAGIIRRPGETFDTESAEDARVLRLAGLVDAPLETPAPVDDASDLLPAPTRRQARRVRFDESPLTPVTE
jgi:hypothetical protein